MAKQVFTEFKLAVQKQFKRMQKYELFVVNVEKDLVWDTYLSSFPEGSNQIFRERTEYDCQCCKSFIRSVGRTVAIIDGKIESIWDIENIGGNFQVVADALSDLIKSKPIDNIFLNIEKTAGTDSNKQMLESGDILTWEHFFVKIPNKFVVSGLDKGTKLSDARSTKDVFLRALKEISKDSIDIVFDLIEQNSLHRGTENKTSVDTFRQLKNLFIKLTNDTDREIFCWSHVNSFSKAVTKIRSSSIGTLLIDLSKDRDLEDAVKSYEDKVSGTNYQRTTALVTKSMITNAQNRVKELGLEDSLKRRFAITEDITINNVLFANRETRKIMDEFDEMISNVPEKVKNLDRVEEVTIDSFIENILPKADSIELMIENAHIPNFNSLIAPVNPDAHRMFKWHNNFSWAYNGGFADDVKTKVKNAGGNVDGDFRASLSWYNYDDLDLHMRLPNGAHVYFSHCFDHDTGCKLDVDMNAHGGDTRSAVENICIPSRDKMPEGEYTISVKNYCRRENVDVGFEVEMEFDGIVHSFGYAKAVPDGRTIKVVAFKYSRSKGIEIIDSIPSSQTSKEVWGISTHQFHNVSMVMHSPNYWDEKTFGNKHYFFMIDNCINENPARGFFNEFLRSEFREDRKVFEILGSKMKTEDPSEQLNQLSGLGFSSTKRNSVLCRVKGSFNRIVKINF